MLGTSRRAELFARALDGEAVGDAQTQSLLGVASRLTALQVAAPRPAARLAGRTALVAAAGVATAELARHAAAAAAAHTAASTAAHSAQAAAKTAAAKTGLFAGLAHSTAFAFATGTAVVVVGAGAVGVSAHRSLPGDPFYGVKRQAEAIHLDLAGSPQAKAKVRLSHAQARLTEIHALWPQTTSDAHTAQIASLVGSMDHDVALATQPLLTAGGAAAQQLTTTVTQLQTTLASFPHTLTGTGAAAVATSVHLLGTLSTTVAKVPSSVTGTTPATPAVPSAPIPVAPRTSATQPAPTSAAPTTSPTAPATTAPAPSVSSTPLVSVPVTVPPVVGSVLPTPVASAVCGLLGSVVSVGGLCPTS